MKKKVNKFSILSFVLCLVFSVFPVTGCHDNQAEDDFERLQVEAIEDSNDSDANDGVTETKDICLTDNQEKQKTENADLLCVYITGAVKCPGVYMLNEGARLYEAIELAGGFAEEAKTDYLNLAGMLSDGIHINVLTEEIYEEYMEKSPEKIISDSSGFYTPVCVSDMTGSETGNAGAKNADSSATVNINSAGLEELITLPGIGEARASAILSYRSEQGGFQRIEDIMNVNGIGESLFSRIKGLISVD